MMMSQRITRAAGFTLLPVILAMSLIAAIAFLLNRDNGMNTEMISDQNDMERARYAAEAGLQAANAKVQSFSCAGGYPVSGTPVTDSNFGGASYSAYATSASGNTTSLVSTGTYNGTSVTLTRNNIYAYQSATKTYTLQPNATVGMDTYIDSANISNNYGNSNKLSFKKNQQNLLFKFDLSAFPAGSRPVSATFSILQSDGLLVGLDYYRVTSDWVEGTGANSPLDGATWNTRNGTATWTTAGGDYHAARLNANTVVNAVGSWADFDATDLATVWLSGQYPNYGIAVVDTGDLGTNKFYSSDDSTAANRPKIVFNYLLPCGTTGPFDPPPVTTQTLTPTADSFNDSGATSANNGAASTIKTYYTTPRENRILMQYDTSSIPSGSTVQSATLRMYVSGTASATTNTKSIWLSAINESWVEGAGNNTNKTCPTITAGTSWNYPTGCTNWSYIHPPNNAPTWTAMANLPTARTNHMVASVNNKIYVIGGYSPSVGTFNTVEEYDPATNTWATKAPMPTNRSDAGIAVVNNKIYVMGGTSNFSTSIAVNEMYDPATNTWTTKAPMLSARMFLAAGVVNNKIYAIGGVKTGTTAVKNNEEYDPATNIWTIKTQMPTAREYLVVQAANNKIYAMGGLTGTSTAMNNNEEYDPSTNTWATKAALPTASYAMGSGIFDGNIYLIGGVQGGSPSKTMLQYDVLNNLYSAKLNYPISISWPVSASINGYIYSIGGDDNVATVYQNHYRYDPGMPSPIATAYDEATTTSPLAAGFTSGWVDFDIKTLVQEWVDGVRVNNGVVIYTNVSDQFSINSRENSANKPQLIVKY